MTDTGNHDREFGPTGTGGFLVRRWLSITLTILASCVLWAFLPDFRWLIFFIWASVPVISLAQRGCAVLLIYSAVVVVLFVLLWRFFGSGSREMVVTVGAVLGPFYAIAVAAASPTAQDVWRMGVKHSRAFAAECSSTHRVAWWVLVTSVILIAAACAYAVIRAGWVGRYLEAVRRLGEQLPQ
jgi:hypothetical protein